MPGPVGLALCLGGQRREWTWLCVKGMEVGKALLVGVGVLKGRAEAWLGMSLCSRGGQRLPFPAGICL